MSNYKNSDKRKQQDKDYAKKNSKKLQMQRIKRRYNLDEDSSYRLVDKVTYKCECCGFKYNEECKRKLHVDHCHTTDKVRGVLCHSCNLALGLLEESIDRVNLLAKYIKDHC